MATFFPGESHTFSEYLLVPGYSSSECIPNNVSLKTPLTRFKRGEKPAITLNIPMVSAIMQSVSGVDMGVALATEGGMSFIYGSQTPESEAAMVKAVKDHKAGFVESDSTLTPKMTMSEVMALKDKTGHSTMPVTDDGTPRGKLLGIVTSRDYRPSRDDHSALVETFMTPREKLIVGDKNITLKKANDVIWENKLNALPVVDDYDHLIGIVFRKDYDSHKTNPNELLDANKRYMVGAGINTRDYAERVPAAGRGRRRCACALTLPRAISEWQKRTIEWVRANYGEDVKVGAGNVVDAEGFRFLADCGADFIKVGIGGGSICITRETKGIGRGQATALIDVCRSSRRVLRGDRRLRARLLRRRHRLRLPHDACTRHGCRLHDARPLLRSLRREPDRPSVNGQRQLHEGVLGRGLCARPQLAALRPGRRRKAQLCRGCRLLCALRWLSVRTASTVRSDKVKSTMCNCGALSIPELQEKARLTLVSSTSIVEGGAHDVVVKDTQQTVSYR